MPLSEHEQRLLDQIERALYAEDPKFATAVRSTDLRSHMRRRIARMIALFVIGFVMMLFGIKFIALGVAGFVVMLGALFLGANAYKRMNGGGSATLRSVDGGSSRSTSSGGRSGGGRKAKTDGSAKDRLEERWRKRWEERGGPQ